MFPFMEWLYIAYEKTISFLSLFHSTACDVQILKFATTINIIGDIF